MCTTFKITECGHPHFYAFGFSIVLLPVIFQKRLRNIGKFSLVILIFTLISILLIIYICVEIIKQPLKVSNKEYDLKLKPVDKKIDYWNLPSLPMFCSAMMNIFEGNQQILNLYSEADKPQDFFRILCTLFIVMLVFLAILAGMLGYFAFGNSCDSIILLNLPNNSKLATISKLFYCLTIMGSFVIVVQPVFYVMERSLWYSKIFKTQENSKFYMFRTLLVFLVISVSFIFPDLNLVLTLGGAVLGTIMTIVVPIMFYNKAYSDKASSPEK